MTENRLEGQPITSEGNKLVVPNDPIIPFIEGDGTGPDIWRATRRVLDAAVETAYNGERKLVWHEVLAGEKAFNETGEWLPQDTLETIQKYRVALKGPLTTPVGGGIRSLNVAIRQLLDLYACIRPVRWFKGVPSPVREPWKFDMVIFRENTEDIYAGIEWQKDTPEVKKLIEFLREEYGKEIRPDSGVGIKPISVTGTKRLTRMAIEYAKAQGRNRITFVHKGNIMKFTEGAFCEWGYEVAREEYPEDTVTWEQVRDEYNGQIPEGKIMMQDSIADIMFQHLMLRPEDHQILVAPNLNGDYLSDAAAAIVGGIGMAPGANVGSEVAVFEATHGTAPKYANLDKVNPSSLILSGVMLLEHIGWQEAAKLIINGIETTIGQNIVTYDLARNMENATEVKTSEFADALIGNFSRS